MQVNVCPPSASSPLSRLKIKAFTSIYSALLCKQPINSSSVIVSYHAHPAGLSPLLSNLGSVSDTSLK